MREAWITLRVFGSAIFRGWAGRVGALATTAGVVLGLLQANQRPSQPGQAARSLTIPLEVWLGILIGGLVLAIAQAFHGLRKERDVARNQIESCRTKRSLEIGGLRHRTSGTKLADFQMRVGVELHNFGDDVILYQVESMSVVIEGRTIAHPFVHATTEQISPGKTIDFLFPPISGIDIRRPIQGSLEMVVKYGHPDLGFARQLSQKRTFHYGIDTEINRYANQPNWDVDETRDEIIDVPQSGRSK